MELGRRSMRPWTFAPSGRRARLMRQGGIPRGIKSGDPGSRRRGRRPVAGGLQRTSGSSGVRRTSSTTTPSPSRRSTSRRASCSRRSTGRPCERGGYPVHFVSRLGPREFVDPALQRGLVELVPEYAGTALQFTSLGRVRPSASTAANHRRLVDRLAGRPVVALAPSPAQDSNVIVTTRRDRGAPPAPDHQRPRATPRPGSCSVDHRSARSGRSACRACERTYGLRFGRVLALDAGGPLTHQVLAAGEADVALLFSTDSADHRRRSGRPARRPAPAAGGEHHPTHPSRARGSLGRRPHGPDRRGLATAHDRGAAASQRRAHRRARQRRRRPPRDGWRRSVSHDRFDHRRPAAGAGRPTSCRRHRHRPHRTSTPADAGAARPAPRHRCPRAIGRTGTHVAGRARGARDLGRRRTAPRSGPADHRPARRRDPPAARAPAHVAAHRRGPRDRSARHRLGRLRVRGRPDRRPPRAAPLAPPVRADRRRDRSSSSSAWASTRASPGPGRTASRSSAAGATGRCRRRRSRCSRRCSSPRPTPSWCPDGHGTLAKLVSGVLIAAFVGSSPLPRHRPSVRRRRRGGDRRRDPAAALPDLRAPGGVPGRVPEGQDRPPRRRAVRGARRSAGRSSSSSVSRSPSSVTSGWPGREDRRRSA